MEAFGFCPTSCISRFVNKETDTKCSFRPFPERGSANNLRLLTMFECEFFALWKNPGCRVCFETKSLSLQRPTSFHSCLCNDVITKQCTQISQRINSSAFVKTQNFLLSGKLSALAINKQPRGGCLRKFPIVCAVLLFLTSRFYEARSQCFDLGVISSEYCD